MTTLLLTDSLVSAFLARRWPTPPIRWRRRGTLLVPALPVTDTRTDAPPAPAAVGTPIPDAATTTAPIDHAGGPAPSALIRVWRRPGATARVIAGRQAPAGVAPVTRVFGDDSTTETDIPQLVLDALVHIARLATTDGRATRLWVGHSPVREQLHAAGFTVPGIELVTDPHALPLPARLTRAVDRLIAETAAAVHRDPPPAPVIPIGRRNDRPVPPPGPSTVVEVGTDASVRQRHAGTGIAAVTADGRWAQAFLPRTSNIAVGELQAVRLATLRFGRPGVRLDVSTDSRAAVCWITHPAKARPDARAVAFELHELLRTGRLTVTWVRGHGDHALNLAADRLALAARRCRAAAVAPDAQEAMAARIVADVLGAHRPAA